MFYQKLFLVKVSGAQKKEGNSLADKKATNSENLFSSNSFSSSLIVFKHLISLFIQSAYEIKDEMYEKRSDQQISGMFIKLNLDRFFFVFNSSR